MGMFSNLMSKIFGQATTTTAPASSGPATASGSAGAAGPATGSGAASASGPAMATPGTGPATASKVAGAGPTAPAEVDVTAILDGLAAKNSEKLDWKKSIVDLLKLVGMDSSLSARKELATELHYSGDQGDSATMNVWLHQEVLKKIAANGGKVPADLLD